MVSVFHTVGQVKVCPIDNQNISFGKQGRHTWSSQAPFGGFSCLISHQQQHLIPSSSAWQRHPDLVRYRGSPWWMLAQNEDNNNKSHEIKRLCPSANQRDYPFHDPFYYKNVRHIKFRTAEIMHKSHVFVDNNNHKTVMTNSPMESLLTNTSRQDYQHGHKEILQEANRQRQEMQEIVRDRTWTSHIPISELAKNAVSEENIVAFRSKKVKSAIQSKEREIKATTTTEVDSENVIHFRRVSGNRLLSAKRKEEENFFQLY